MIHSESFEESSSVQGEDEDYQESDDEAVPQKGKKVMVRKVEKDSPERQEVGSSSDYEPSASEPAHQQQYQ